MSNRHQRRSAGEPDFGYFRTLIPITPEQVITIVDALQRGEPVVLLVNPDPKAYLLLVSSESRGLPYEVDLAVLASDMKTPLGMTERDRDRIMPWTSELVKRVCTLWQERYKPH